MKILFFLALLVNIIVFLWEYNSISHKTADVEIDNNKDKQILLVSELSTEEKDKLLIQASNKVDVIDFSDFPKGDTISERENKEIDKLVKNAPNLAITTNKDNKIVLKSDREPHKKNANHEAEQFFLKSKVVKANGKKASAVVNITTVGENLVVKEKLNSTDKKLTEVKSIEVTHLVKDALIPSVENISLAMVNKDPSKEKINNKTKIKEKDLKKESSINIEEKEGLSVDNKVDEKKRLDISKVGSKNTKKESLKSKTVANTVQDKQVSKLAISSTSKKARETKSANKKPEENVRSKVSGLDKVKASAEQKKSNLQGDIVSIVKKINTSKVSEEKILPNKIKQPEFLNTQCYDIGPFQNKAAFEVWRKDNKIKLSSNRLLKKNTSKASSFLVYYPPAKNFEESKKNVQILKRMGITDYWLFLKGDLKGAISLGLFSKESRALRFQEKLGNMGLDVKIKHRYKTATVLYTQVTTNDKKFKETVIISKMQTISKCKAQKISDSQ